MPKIFNIENEKEMLIELYVNQRLGSKAVGKVLGISSPTVLKRLIFHEIPIRTNGRRMKALEPDKKLMDFINDTYGVDE